MRLSILSSAALALAGCVTAQIPQGSNLTEYHLRIELQTLEVACSTCEVLAHDFKDALSLSQYMNYLKYKDDKDELAAQELISSLDESQQELLEKAQICWQWVSDQNQLLLKKYSSLTRERHPTPETPHDMRPGTAEALANAAARLMGVLMSPVQGAVDALQPPAPQTERTMPTVQYPHLLNNGLLGPMKYDAYGPGMHSDATGRPFQFRTQQGDTVLGPVNPDAYGLGVHMDKYGRPVEAAPEW